MREMQPDFFFLFFCQFTESIVCKLDAGLYLSTERRYKLGIYGKAFQLVAVSLVAVSVSPLSTGTYKAARSTLKKKKERKKRKADGQNCFL